MVDELPITGYRLPITGYRLPITGYRLPITGHRSPNVQSAQFIPVVQNSIFSIWINVV